MPTCCFAGLWIRFGAAAGYGPSIRQGSDPEIVGEGVDMSVPQGTRMLDWDPSQEYPYPEILVPGTIRDSTEVPAIFSCASARIHPLSSELETKTVDWVHRNRMFERDLGIPAEEAEARFLRQRHAVAHAMLWPDATAENLWMANKWALWSWFLDDHFDEVWFRQPSDEALIITTAVKAVLRGRRPAARGNDPLVATVRSLREEAEDTFPEAWLRHFVGRYCAYIDACLVELDRYRRPRIVPTSAQYLSLRNYAGGVFVAAGWTEIALNCRLPESVYESNEVHDLTMRFNHIVCWGNDVYAFPKEAAIGDGFNLVAVLTVHGRRELSQAVADVTRQCKAELDTLNLLSSVAGELDGPTEDVTAYAQGLVTFVNGFLDWTSRSTRYREMPVSRSTTARHRRLPRVAVWCHQSGPSVLDAVAVRRVGREGASMTCSGARATWPVT
jgi:hypothetical protein